MKITDKTFEQKNGITFNVGDIVKAESESEILFLLIARSDIDHLCAIDVSDGERFEAPMRGTAYQFDASSIWTFRKVTAELILTD